nr:DUF4442 domain-containing protein [Thermotomaculum hydrothermale]
MIFYPPFLFSGIKVEKVSKDFRYIKVRLKLRWYNRNYVGTQFGGSLFSMTDPFYMIMLIKNLGKDYIVWDKKSCIKFIKPGTTDVFAEFRIDDEIIENIKREVDKNGKGEFPFTVEIKDKSGQLIALVEKIEYVRKK